MKTGFARRLTLALGLLLLAFGVFVALLVQRVGLQQERESLQRVSHGLARHIVEHWPAVRSSDPDDRAAREDLLRMLVTVNPAVRVYLLDADGVVNHYIGEPGMVRTPRVDLASVRAFLAGAPPPLLGTDPMGGAPRTFSAAMFPPRPGDARPPGYLYVILEASEVAPLARTANPAFAWQGMGWVLGIGMLVMLLVGALIVSRLTVPLNRLAQRMQVFNIDGAPVPVNDGAAVGRPDEIAAIGQAFDRLSARVTEQVRCRESQAAEHREVMANVAHDLRTPLTALHGHLEALGAPGIAEGDALLRQRLLDAALSQSNKVRHLSRQLFELATLQSIDDLQQRERFRLDELVTDTVQKFHPGIPQPAVALAVTHTGPIVLDGDLHLIERALSNLIDNAVRHAASAEPVQVSLHCDGVEARVLVADGGPGLPAELMRRLAAGQPVREPALQQPGGGMGGLGLAIAQRVAQLHGGSLRAMPTPGRGALLALVLPLPALKPDASA